MTSALYETTAFLVGQHMAQHAVTGTPAPPMPERVSAWAVYDVFDTADGQVFVGVVSDGQWQSFCQAFDKQNWANDPALAANKGRVAQRDTLIPAIRDMFRDMTSTELSETLEQIGLPFAPIKRPQDLADDPHLKAGGLADLRLPDSGETVSLPILPIEFDQIRASLKNDLKFPGQDSDDILNDLGLDPAILRSKGITG